MDDTLQLEPPASMPDDDALPDPMDLTPEPFGAPDGAFQGDPAVRAWM